MSQIAREYSWGHAEILGLPVLAAFHYALRAQRVRWERLEDIRMAAAFAHLDDRSRESLVGRICHMLSGPGKTVPYEETLSPQVRREMQKCQQETDRLYEAFEQSGILVRADGSGQVFGGMSK